MIYADVRTMIEHKLSPKLVVVMCMIREKNEPACILARRFKCSKQLMNQYLTDLRKRGLAKTNKGVLAGTLLKENVLTVRGEALLKKLLHGENNP